MAQAIPHLRVHSYYTLLGATASPEALAQRAAANGMTHLALTDLNALYGAVAFSRACEKQGIQPITGMTVSVAWPADLSTLPDTGAGRLVLLAQDIEGYRSLCRLSALIQAHEDRETLARRGLTLDDLAAHASGLICLTGGRSGFIYRCLQPGAAAHYDRAAHRFLGRLCAIYGPERVCASLELHIAADYRVAAQLAAKAQILGIRTVAVQPVYTLERKDRPRLRLLAAIDRNCGLGDLPPAALPDGGDRHIDLHWLEPTDMARRFADYPGALQAAHEIAAQCGPALPDGRLQWPTLDLAKGVTPEAQLRHQAEVGAGDRYDTPLSSHIQERLDRELATIANSGYCPLFLVVADIVRYARDHDIPVSTRGSVANSLIAYVLGITTVDPIAHGLLFERFLSPGRADPPDIDLDFCSRRRDEVLAYIRDTYGADRTALVGAMSTLQLRSAARETAKAYGLDDPQTRKLLAELPRRYHPMQQERDLADVLIALNDPWLQEVARAAYGISGFPHHLSIHAGGLVITPGPLTDLVPVQMAPKGYLTTQFDHGDCEAVGLPKLDLLGIRALTVLADAAEQVRIEQVRAAQTRAAQTRSPEGDATEVRFFRLDDIPPDDPLTAELLMRGDTVGVFQCDSIGARRTLRKLQARSVQDLAVANAFFKPGPATGGQADVFVRRYRGEVPTRYQHPSLEPILAPTKGVLIFQEQVLRVATEIAGLSWAQADHIRRGMSKMAPEEMRSLASAFIEGCQRPGGPGLSREQAEQLWQQVSAFSGYGFNQGHATAYADVSYRSAYMKAHYPAAFFWARLRNYGGYHHPAVYMAEAIRLGIQIRLPHVNHSRTNVVLAWEGDAADAAGPDASQPVLWLGLGLIRDLRRQAIAEVVRARRRGPFTDLQDVLMRVTLQPKEVIHLIQAGALDGLGANRPAMLREAQTLARAGSARQMAFDFATTYAAPASRRQRLAWERHLVGYPVGVLQAWLPELAQASPTHTPVSELAASREPATTVAVRLPGRHRGGYAIWDGADWAWTEVADGTKPPPVWDPVRFEGHWRSDRWGMGWFVVQRWTLCGDERP
ncbi:MAG: DNA polymerase III subunit alpha [Anaerolineae bacterium]